MSIVTFWNGTDEQVGTTSSAIAFAVQSSIQHNMKILLIPTSLNNTLVKDCFWKENDKKSRSLLSNDRGNTNNIEQSGIEGLGRLMRSNRISPERITQYTKVLLRDRLEVLLGVYGDYTQDVQQTYDEIKEQYEQIISLADRFYDMVIVDLDNSIGEKIIKEILKITDVIVAMTSQKAKEIQKVQELIEQRKILKEENTVLTIGKYMEDTKYNAKNITRNLLRRKDLINVVPYNNLYFEASQEGRVIDIFFDFMKIKEKDINYKYAQSLSELFDTIQEKIQMLQMNRKV